MQAQPTISHLVQAGQAIRQAQLAAQASSKAVAAQLGRQRPAQAAPAAPEGQGQAATP